MINESRFRLKKNGEPNCDCFCRHPELIENYDLAIVDTTQTWDCHHRREDTFSQEELKERGEYFDVEPEDLIFLTKVEHSKIDSKCKRVGEARKGMKHSEETKRRISEALKGHKKPEGAGRPSKKVICVETGEIFESTMDVERKTGINNGNISKACKGKLKTTGGYHWEFVL